MGECDSQPKLVNNARIISSNDNNTTVTVIYECLAGFEMTGVPRIVCNRTMDVWDAAPTCRPILQNSYFNNYNTITSPVAVWWYYLLAGLLGFLALLFLGALFWCCCCSSATSVYPYSQNSAGRAFYCRGCCFRRLTNARLSTTSRLQQSQRGSNFLTNKRTSEQSAAENQRQESQVCTNVRPAKDPAKENKIWMPHTHGVRNNNTSTK